MSAAITKIINGIEWSVRVIDAKGTTSFSAYMTERQYIDSEEFLTQCHAKGWTFQAYSARDDADMEPGTVQVCVFAPAHLLAA